jgi:hypothetical protein
MSDVQPFLANAIAEHIFRGNPYPNPTDITIGLFIESVEVSGAGYARVSYWGASNWGAAVNGLTRNLNAVTFPAPSGDWGVITHAGIFDQDGNLLIHRRMSSTKTINNGDPAFSFDVSEIAGQVL